MCAVKKYVDRLLSSLTSPRKCCPKSTFSITKMLLLCLFQKCDAGFFFAYSEECLPCDCNGNSNECLDGSGLCVVGRGHVSLFIYFTEPLHLWWR